MQQFKRKYSLHVGEVGSEALLVENLHVSFKVLKAKDSSSKNVIDIKVYNLTRITRDAIDKDQTLVFKVSYGDSPLTTLFLGEVTGVFTNSAGVDVVTTIQATEGMKEAANAKTAITFRKGATVKDVLTQLFTQDMKLASPRFSNGTLPPSEGINKIYSGSSKAGSTAYIINEVCEDNNLTWTLTEGIVDVFPKNGAPEPLDVKTLNSSSGMIGSPEKILTNLNQASKSKSNKRGFKVKTLLDPALNVGGYVELESSSVSSITGLFSIDKVLHTGDYEGNAWYSQLEVSEPNSDE